MRNTLEFASILLVLTFTAACNGRIQRTASAGEALAEFTPIPATPLASPTPVGVLPSTGTSPITVPNPLLPIYPVYPSSPGNLSGDVSGPPSSTVVNRIAGVDAALIASAATKVFGGTITATLNGNALTATYAENAKSAQSALSAAMVTGTGVIVDSHVSASANLSPSKLASGPDGAVLTTRNGVPTWARAADFYEASSSLQTDLAGRSWQSVPGMRLRGVTLSTGDVVRLTFTGTYAVLSASVGGTSILRFALNGVPVGPLQPVGAVASGAVRWGQPVLGIFRCGTGANEIVPGTYEVILEAYPGGSTAEETLRFAPPFTVGESSLRLTAEVTH